MIDAAHIFEYRRHNRHAEDSELSAVRMPANAISTPCDAAGIEPATLCLDNKNMLFNNDACMTQSRLSLRRLHDKQYDSFHQYGDSTNHLNFPSAVPACDPLKRGSLYIFEQIIDAPERFPVLLLPRAILIPSAIIPKQLHSSILQKLMLFQD